MLNPENRENADVGIAVEQEKIPDAVLELAVTAAETANPKSCEWGKKIGRFSKKTGAIATDVLGLGVSSAFRLAWGALKLTKDLALSKGGMGFGKAFESGYKYGSGALDYDSKKEKK